MSSRQGSLEAKCLQHPDCMEGPRGASTHTLPLPTGVGAQQVPGEQWPACNSSSPRSGGDALRGQRAHVILRLSGGDTQPQSRVQHFLAGGGYRRPEDTRAGTVGHPSGPERFPLASVLFPQETRWRWGASQTSPGTRGSPRSPPVAPASVNGLTSECVLVLNCRRDRANLRKRGGKATETVKTSCEDTAGRKNSRGLWEFPGGLVVRIVGFHCCGQGTILAQGTKILQAARHGQKKKKRPAGESCKGARKTQRADGRENSKSRRKSLPVASLPDATY